MLGLKARLSSCSEGDHLAACPAVSEGVALREWRQVPHSQGPCRDLVLYSGQPPCQMQDPRLIGPKKTSLAGRKKRHLKPKEWPPEEATPKMFPHRQDDWPLETEAKGPRAPLARRKVR